ncbi:MAG TPA: peptidylprolyl isomerase [Candidatus Deferrimicrobium sp.]|nr:peptidylprolyl isomerase [Candidatus Deferrimicrobium sp.]
MKKLYALVLVGILLVAVGCSKPTPQQPTPAPSGTAQDTKPQIDQPPTAQRKVYTAPPAMQIDPQKQYHATIQTNQGDIGIKLFASESPKTVNNFVFLAKEKFYDGIKFHRIIKDFMIQTGDPKGNGTGGPGYKFEDELPTKHNYVPGIVAMANAGPNTNGSQFFIGSGDKVKNLDKMPNYTIFGQVDSGMDVVQKIASVEVTAGPSGEQSTPVQEVLIKGIIIEEK